MKAMRTSCVLWGIPLVLITAAFCPLAHSKVITVGDGGQADFDHIQAGIDAAQDGDTVSVAPGIYYENVRLREGIRLIGSGADVTVIDANGYGDVVDARANDAAVCGFTLRNSGESDLGHMNCGVYLEGSYAPVVRDNVIVGNRIGLGAWDGAGPDVRNNIMEDNAEGVYLYGSQESPTNPSIVNNTIVGNQVDGIVLRDRVSPTIINNIILGHLTGINHNYVTGTPLLRYNNLWDNDVDYLRDGKADKTLAGPGSLSVDPYFARPGYWADVNDVNVAVVEHDGPNAVWIRGDYHLKSQAGRYDPNGPTWVLDDVTSPCIDRGDPNSPVGDEPMPNGGTINLGVYGGTGEASKSFSGRHAKYGGGTGEPNDPYLISTARQMNAIGAEPNDWGRHFQVTADIDLSAFDGKNRRPAFHIIAPDTDPDTASYQGIAFTGVFDGGNHKLSHLTISGVSYLGLFGELAPGAQVRAVGIEDVNVTGSGDSIAALAATNRGSIIRCYSTGVINATGKAQGHAHAVGGLIASNLGDVTGCHSLAHVIGGSHVGGVVGDNSGTVAGCHSAGSVRGGRSVGGFVGENLGIVTRCCARGPVVGESYVGGLLGENYQGLTTDCYSTGAVSGGSYVGGLVGQNGGPTDPGKLAVVARCYSTGEVKGQGYTGGLAGWNLAAVIGSLWDSQTAGLAASAGGKGKTTAQMQTVSTFLEAGWDFVGETANGSEDIWWINEGKDYPGLGWERSERPSEN